uniref:Uncharacterized protein n=1 Tax=Rhizophora mucronata TaxID=61149 RepID=A0A2P2P4E3_RHIMU
MPAFSLCYFNAMLKGLWIWVFAFLLKMPFVA